MMPVVIIHSGGIGSMVSPSAILTAATAAAAVSTTTSTRSRVIILIFKNRVDTVRLFLLSYHSFVTTTAAATVVLAVMA